MDGIRDYFCTPRLVFFLFILKQVEGMGREGFGVEGASGGEGRRGVNELAREGRGASMRCYASKSHYHVSLKKL